MRSYLCKYNDHINVRLHSYLNDSRVLRGISSEHRHIYNIRNWAISGYLFYGFKIWWTNTILISFSFHYFISNKILFCQQRKPFSLLGTVVIDVQYILYMYSYISYMPLYWIGTLLSKASIRGLTEDKWSDRCPSSFIIVWAEEVITL